MTVETLMCLHLCIVRLRGSRPRCKHLITIKLPGIHVFVYRQCNEDVLHRMSTYHKDTAGLPFRWRAGLVAAIEASIFVWNDTERTKTKCLTCRTVYGF